MSAKDKAAADEAWDAVGEAVRVVLKEFDFASSSQVLLQLIAPTAAHLLP